MKKDILFAITNLNGGGAEKVLVDILNNIDFEKFNIDLLLLKKEGVYLEKLDSRINLIYDSKNINSIYSKYIQKRFIKYFPKIFYKKLIKKIYDVEVSFLEGLPTKVIANSNNKNSKKIAWVHIDLLKKHWTKYIYKKGEEIKCYEVMDDLVFVSEAVKTSFKKMFKNNSKKHVIYNPIISDDIICKANEEKIKFGEFTIISVGRLDDQKGYDKLIKTHAKLVNKYKHRLLIIGEGPKRLELEKLIYKLGVSSTVELKGFVTNPYKYVNAADLFVSSSITEGHPLAVLEAIVLGKAIVGTKITGTNEILDNGKYGIICESSQRGLDEAIEYIFKNNSIIKKLEEKSCERARQFNYKDNIKSIESLLLK